MIRLGVPVHSLDGDRFSQVARLIDVGTLEHRYVIGKQLERNGVDDRRYRIFRGRDIEDMNSRLRRNLHA